MDDDEEDRDAPQAVELGDVSSVEVSFGMMLGAHREVRSRAVFSRQRARAHRESRRHPVDVLSSGPRGPLAQLDRAALS